MRAFCASFLLFLFIIFQHFTLTTVLSYELTLGTVAGLLLLIFIIDRTSYCLTIITWCSLVAVSGLAVLSSGYAAGSSYAATALLFLLTSAIICSAFGRINQGIVRSAAFKNAALVSLAVVTVLSIVQVVAANLGNASFYNPFGTRQYFHEYKHFVGLIEFPRAQGFYLEPSYNAFVIGSLGVVLLTLKWKAKRTLVLVVLGVIASQSATAIILLAGLLLISLLRASVRLRVVALITGCILMVFSGTYLLLRLQTITTEGSSAYYRIFAPVDVMIDVLTFAPIGKPFGSVEETIAGYNLFMAGVPATSLDNGFYVLVFYFGWLGVIAILVFLISTIRAITSRSVFSERTWVARFWIFGAVSFSGAIMTPQFGLTLALIVIAIRAQGLDRASATEKNSPAFRSNRHLRRSFGPAPDTRLVEAAH